MFVIVRENKSTSEIEVLCKDENWVLIDSWGSFQHWRYWVDALQHLLTLERDHDIYDYRTTEIPVIFK